MYIIYTQIHTHSISLGYVLDSFVWFGFKAYQPLLVLVINHTYECQWVCPIPHKCIEHYCEGGNKVTK